MSVRASIQQSSVQQCFDASNCFDKLLCWERGRVPGLLLGLEAIPKPDYMYTQVSRMVWSSRSESVDHVLRRITPSQSDLSLLHRHVIVQYNNTPATWR